MFTNITYKYENSDQSEFFSNDGYFFRFITMCLWYIVYKIHKMLDRKNCLNYTAFGDLVITRWKKWEKIHEKKHKIIYNY